eukprot:Em0009g812a
MGLATLTLVLLLCALATGDQVEISLDGDSWILSDTTGRVNKIPATVPGQVHLDLWRAGIIGDPYLEYNDDTLKWVAYSDWIYSTTFSLSQSDIEGNTVFLKCDGLDTVAQIMGGGLYQVDWFYDLCDQLGIMVWQEMMFACALYPRDTNFLDNVRGEVTHQVRRLGHHASIVLWSGNNENQDEGASTPQNLVDYSALYDGVVRTTLWAEDMTRAYWPASPSNGFLYDDKELGLYVQRWGPSSDPTYGDVHSTLAVHKISSGERTAAVSIVGSLQIDTSDVTKGSCIACMYDDENDPRGENELRSPKLNNSHFSALMKRPSGGPSSWMMKATAGLNPATSPSEILEQQTGTYIIHSNGSNQFVQHKEHGRLADDTHRMPQGRDADHNTTEPSGAG